MRNHKKLFLAAVAIIIAIFLLKDSIESHRRQSELSLVSEAGEENFNMPQYPPLFYSEGSLEAKVIYQGPSLYGEITVFDYADFYRVLMIDGTMQGVWDFKNKSASTHTHDTNVFLKNYLKDIKDILVIGMGGGTMLKELEGSDLKIDVVEINPKVAEAAKKYFVLPKDLDYKIVVDDGRHFLQTTNKKYDVIMLDLCDIFDSNAHLWTQESFQLIKSKLKTKDGILIANLNVFRSGDEYGLDHMVANTIRQSFKNIYFIDRGKDSPDLFSVITFFASNEQIDISLLLADISIEIWDTDLSYPIVTDRDTAKIVRYYIPAAEKLRKQAIENFGFPILLKK